MIDITKIDKQTLSMLTGAYLHAAYHFGMDPVEASKKEQRRIRRWLTKQYKESVGVFPEFSDIFSESNSDQDVLHCLKACHDVERVLLKKEEDKFEADFASVDEGTKTALKQLLDFPCWPQIRAMDHDIQILVEETSAYRKFLILKNARGVPQVSEGCVCSNLRMAREKEENKFCFSGELDDFAGEKPVAFAVTFDGAETEIVVFNACGNVTVWDDPWELLSWICMGICRKAELPGMYCNGKETELLSLIRQIDMVEYWHELPENAYISFAELKKLASRHNAKEAEAMLEKLETISTRGKDFYTYWKKLRSAFCQTQCAPMWREIYNKILASQAEYKSKADVFCDEGVPANTRKEIQALLEAKGYTGSYPDFVKVGALKGIHLEQAYHTTYFVGMEKRVRYHIHCLEGFDENGNLSIRFLSGTALLKKDEEETDIFDCLFDAKGRRFFHTLDHAILSQEQENAEAISLETAVAIAVKKAECIRLNKQERNAFYGVMLPSWGAFWLFFLIGGGLFGIIMTLGMMLLSILITAAFGLFSEIPEMLRTLPWGMLLAISWIGFGGVMGILDILARRK